MLCVSSGHASATLATAPVAPDDRQPLADAQGAAEQHIAEEVAIGHAAETSLHMLQSQTWAGAR